MKLDVMMRTIWCTAHFDAYHRWPEARDANAKRGYLADLHRHRFGVKAAVTVRHDDREVEFHDLADMVTGWCMLRNGLDLGRRSCEDLATELAEHLAAAWPGRRYRVTIDEDRVVGATLTFVDHTKAAL